MENPLFSTRGRSYFWRAISNATATKLPIVPPDVPSNAAAMAHLPAHHWVRNTRMEENGKEEADLIEEGIRYKVKNAAR